MFTRSVCCSLLFIVNLLLLRNNCVHSLSLSPHWNSTSSNYKTTFVLRQLNAERSNLLTFRLLYTSIHLWIGYLQEGIGNDV